ncbi:alpha-L-fucosidase [Chitinophaga filiformis]|uniref:alpha-L-fucosidase n=1 Tax=Chitinophaga filiformis TaxID=104663 RepID=UPI000B802CAA|nr:alpha-L-fucosidase [Chitinophaga filiformis]
MPQTQYDITQQPNDKVKWLVDVRSRQVWQKCMTVGGAWGYSSAMEDSSRLISFAGIKRMLADVTVRNMSLLLNVGPDRHGVISQPVAHLLQQTGEWLKLRSEAMIAVDMID